MADETVILRVQLDVGKTEERIQALVLDIEQTRAAQQALNKARKDGAVDDAAYARQSVALQAQLKTQRTEFGTLTKNLELYRTASGELAGTYKGMQAQLSLAQRQFQMLDGSADNSTESARLLGQTINELRTTLKDTDATQALFVRNVGNYPKGEELAPLIQQLIKLQEVQKQTVEGSEQYQQVQTRIVGFQQAVSQAGAKAGLSYEQTEAKLKEYGEAIRPATANLVRLEQEQAKAGEVGSEAFRKIGFQVAAMEKQIEQVPTTTKSAGDALSEVDELTNVFGGNVGLLKERFAQARQGIELAKGGFTGLKGAIASTGIGVLILALGALFEYFTKTDEGAEDLAAGLAFLKGGFSVVEGVVISLGKFLSKLFTDPKAALTELGDLIQENLINRLEAASVIIAAVQEGDFGKLRDGVIQAATGIENATAKAGAFASELARAADVAAALSRAEDKLDDDRRKSLVTLEENKNLVDKLVLSAKDRSLSERERLANLDRASKLETENLNLTTRLAQDKLRIIRQQNDEAERTGKLSDEQREAEAEAQTELIRLAGQSASLQQSIANRRSSLLQQEASESAAARQKAQQAAEKAAEQQAAARREALQFDLLAIARRLRAVAEGSNEELSLLQQKLAKERDLELAQTKLTVGQKKLIDEKYEQESSKLLEDSIRRRGVVALQVEAAALQARLAAVAQGSAEELRLQRELIEKQRQQAVAALGDRLTEEERGAQVRLLNANAEKQQADLLYQSRLKAVQAFYQGERNELETARAAGLITERQYQDAVYSQELGASAARRQVAQDLNRDVAAEDQKTTDLQIANRRRLTDASQAEAQKQVQQAQEFGQAVGALFVETINDSGATMEEFAAKTLIIILDMLQKTIIAAQVEILAKSLASAESIATFGVAGFAKAALIIAGVQVAFGAVKSALSQAAPRQFAAGTVLRGPSHAQGGIQIYGRNGYHYGEAEGGEPILTAAVSRDPRLLAAASALNVAAGGRPLVPSSFMAQGGIASALVRDSLAGPAAAPIDYERLADALRHVPLSVSVRDSKAATGRDAFTQAVANA